ncbi:hypothetical protein IE4872_PD01615 (plasmid) [Rhizobium gallicum]|uniref:DUF3861 domain-containing protein n=1 Tax=Rhizobium gallicum TaxID=56730 RepID=A0A1L5NW85_9HYPH|nr:MULTISPECIES: DUF3861 family protein [Rhizobium]APO72136.1 hypothetical protein IE4872_PD01615 [Rhizobium gallicum]QPB22723.1 DUF3861 domain-containing protein [Rhizobium sp. 007]
MASSSYTYEVSLRLVRGRDDSAPVEPSSLVFEHVNHDDIIDIVERMRRTTGLDPNAAAAAAIGLKLLGEVMLREKGNELFDPLRTGFREFITSLKSRAAIERS